MLPNLVGIGPGKSGSTWLYNVLRQHPDICMSKVKETLYFEKYYHKGISWYEDFFSTNENYKIIGEISNTYIYDERVAERISRDLTDVRIIAILRNPIERAFSHYLFLLRNAEVNCSFEECFDIRPDIFKRGLYYEQLSIYFDHFNKEQLGIFIFDDLKKDSTTFLEKIYSFLSVDNSFRPVIENKHKLKAAKPRLVLLSRTVKKVALAVRAIGFPFILNLVKDSFLPKLIYKEYDVVPEISNETKKMLKKYYMDDINKLSVLLNRKELIEEWGGDTVDSK